MCALVALHRLLSTANRKTTNYTDNNSAQDSLRLKLNIVFKSSLFETTGKVPPFRAQEFLAELQFFRIGDSRCKKLPATIQDLLHALLVSGVFPQKPIFVLGRFCEVTAMIAVS